MYCNQYGLLNGDEMVNLNLVLKLVSVVIEYLDRRTSISQAIRID